MKTMPLRDFQREGTKAFGDNPTAEPWLLCGRDREFVLLPVTPENRTAMLDLIEGMAAVMDLRESQARAVEAGLDQMTGEEIDAEIQGARTALGKRRPSA